MIRRPLPDGPGKKEEAKGDRFARDGNPLHAHLPGAGAVPRRAEDADLRPGVGERRGERVHVPLGPAVGGVPVADEGDLHPDAFRHFLVQALQFLHLLPDIELLLDVGAARPPHRFPGLRGSADPCEKGGQSAHVLFPGEEPGPSVEDDLRDVAVPRRDHRHSGSGELRDRDRGAALRVPILRVDARLQEDVRRPYRFEVPVVRQETAPLHPVDDPLLLDEAAHPRDLFVFPRGPAADDHAKHNVRKIPADALERQQPVPVSLLFHRSARHQNDHPPVGIRRAGEEGDDRRVDPETKDLHDPFRRPEAEDLLRHRRSFHEKEGGAPGQPVEVFQEASVPRPRPDIGSVEGRDVRDPGLLRQRDIPDRHIRKMRMQQYGAFPSQGIPVDPERGGPQPGERLLQVPAQKRLPVDAVDRSDGELVEVFRPLGEDDRAERFEKADLVVDPAPRIGKIRVDRMRDDGDHAGPPGLSRGITRSS